MGLGLLFLAATSCGGGQQYPTGTYIYDTGGYATSTDEAAAPGVPDFYGLWSGGVNGTHPVHLLSAEAVGATPGFVVRVWAMRYSDGLGGGLGGGRGQAELDLLRPAFHKVSDVVLDPTCPPVARCTPIKGSREPPQQDWHLVAEGHIPHSGRFTTTGLRVVYEVDGHKYEQTLGYRVGADSSRGSPTPSAT
jgi:hypothetical protein